MFRKMPFILLAIIVLITMTHAWIPTSFQSVLYGLSLSMKSLIVSLLPLIVFGLLFKTAVHFANKASKMILLILSLVCCSNFVSTSLSYLVGTFAYGFDLSILLPQAGEELMPIGNLTFPKWLGNDKAMFLGLALGIALGWLRPALAKDISTKLEMVIKAILKGILFIIPIFIAGCVIKMNHEQTLTYIFRNYALIFALVASTVFLYIISLYLFINRFQIAPTGRSLRNILPAAIAGFGSMSSAAAMPLTILGAEKNSKNPDLARSIIPMTVNIHLIGDCFAIPIFAFAVIKGFGIAEPTLANYFIFAAYFVLAKFSVAAVPGGGILVMLPILESYLGFNADMLSLITALYILFDPVITCANVLGNGAFALVAEKLLKAVSKQESFEGMVPDESLAYVKE